MLRAVLPLLEVVLAERPALAARFAGVDAVVEFGVDGGVKGGNINDFCARLVFSGGPLEVKAGVAVAADVRFGFGSVGALNDFFAGAGGVPRVRGWARHPVLVVKVLGLLATAPLTHLGVYGASLYGAWRMGGPR